MHVKHMMLPCLAFLASFNEHIRHSRASDPPGVLQTWYFNCAIAFVRCEKVTTLCNASTGQLGSFRVSNEDYQRRTRVRNALSKVDQSCSNFRT